MDTKSTASETSNAIMPTAGSQVELRYRRPTHSQPQFETSPTSLLGLIEIPFVHKWLVAACILTFVAIAWLVILIWPRAYESEAKLLIRVGRESVALDPTATVSGQTLLIQKTRMEEVISALGVLGSRKVMESVVQELGAENILNGSLPSDGPAPTGLKHRLKSVVNIARDAVDSLLVGGGLRDNISDGEMAVRRLQETVSFFSPRESAVVTVNATAKTPEMAQAIADTTTREFVRNHMQVSRTPGASDFFKQQAEELESKLDKLTSERTNFMTQNGLMSVTTSRDLLQKELIAISTELLASKGQLEQAEAEYRDAMSSRDNMPETIVAASLERQNTAYSGIRQKLFDLEAKEQRINATLQPNHPRRQVIKEQIAELRAIVAEEQPKSVEQNTTPNPALQRIDTVLVDLQKKIAGLKSLIATKEKQYQTKNEAVDRLLGHEKRLAVMDRDISVAESSLNSLQIKLQESRVIDDMGRDKISNVSIFQPATFIERPVSPKKKVIAALSAIFGAFFGLTWAFMRETQSSAIRTIDHVKSSVIPAPVYALEKIWGIRSRMKRKNSTQPAPISRVCKQILCDFLLSEDWGEQSTLGVISYERGSGTSTLARELSISCSRDCEIQTTLLDADLDNRSVAKSFGVKSNAPINRFASGEVSLDECSVDVGNKLRIVPFGREKGSAHLNSSLEPLTARLRDVRKQVEGNQVMVVDLPPVRDFPEAAALARTLDNVVLVLESEKTTYAEVTKMLRYLDDGNANILCIVLNKTRRHVPGWIQRALGSSRAN